MIIQVQKIREDSKIPARASDGAVGYDVFASIVLNRNTKEVEQELPVEIPAGGAVLIGIGVRMAVPWPYECQVRPRSGLASKHDIELSNSPGTVDPDFRGEAGVLLRNRGDKPFKIEKGMRVAQLVFSEVAIPELVESKELPPTRRGIGGFGSTGLYGAGIGTADYENEITKIDKAYLQIVLAVAERSTVSEEKFGCVIVKNDAIIAQGYKTLAMQAELMALANLLQTGTSAREATIYVNTEPSEKAVDLIANSGITVLVIPGNIAIGENLQKLQMTGINVRIVKQ